MNIPMATTSLRPVTCTKNILGQAEVLARVALHVEGRGGGGNATAGTPAPCYPVSS